MSVPMSITVRGKRYGWSFVFDGDKSNLQEWRDDGLQVEELYPPSPAIGAARDCKQEQLQQAARNALATLKNYERETGIRCPLTIELLEAALNDQKGE